MSVIGTGLAENATGHNRKRCCIQVFCQLEILHITKAHGHHIAPYIKVFLAQLDIPNRFLPIVYVFPYKRTLGNTTT